MRRARRLPSLLAAGALLLLAGGCWDYRDINERTLVIGVAVDAGPGRSHAVTAEVATPGGTVGGRAAAGGGGGALSGRALLRIVADTSAHALGLERERWNRPLEFGHLAVWILGEDYARRGEQDEFGCASCHPAMTVGMHVLVARGRGGDFLAASPPEGVLASVYLIDLVRNALTRGAIPRTNRVSSIVAATAENGVALAPRLSWDGGRPRVAGAAVLRDYRLIGWLDERETLGVSFLQAVGRHTSLVIPCPPLPVAGPTAGEQPLTTFEVQRRSSSLDPELRDGRLRLRYRLRLEGVAMDAGCPRAPGPRGVSGEEELVLGREVAGQVRRLALSAVRRAQELRADFLDWGLILRRYHPLLWRRVKDGWAEEFPRLPVQVDVEVCVRRHARFH